MAKMSKGVIVEFDFTVLNGAEILFDTAKKLLKGAGVELNTRLEALHLAGGNYQGGLAELFEATGRSVQQRRCREGRRRRHAGVQELPQGARRQGTEGRGRHARGRRRAGRRHR